MNNNPIIWEVQLELDLVWGVVFVQAVAELLLENVAFEGLQQGTVGKGAPTALVPQQLVPLLGLAPVDVQLDRWQV